MEGVAKTNTTSVPRVLSVIVATFKARPVFSLTVFCSMHCVEMTEVPH